MRTITVLMLAILLAGCATTTQITRHPDGREESKTIWLSNGCSRGLAILDALAVAAEVAGSVVGMAHGQSSPPRWTPSTASGPSCR